MPWPAQVTAIRAPGGGPRRAAIDRRAEPRPSYPAPVRLAWATDIHLDFLDDDGVRRFAAELAAPRADALILSGDLSHAEVLEHHLRLLAQGVPGPIYFVLGNHDYYGSAI